MNIDLDIIPAESIPKIKLSDSLFLSGDPSAQIFQDSGYPSENLFAIFATKLIELVATILIFFVLYAIDDIVYELTS